QALLHKRSVVPQGLLRRPRFRQRVFQPAMIYRATDEAFHFGHDPPPLLCLHVPYSPNVVTSEPPQGPVTPPTGEARRLDEDAVACIGLTDLWAQADVLSARRSDPPVTPAAGRAPRRDPARRASPTPRPAR